MENPSFDGLNCYKPGLIGHVPHFRDDVPNYKPQFLGDSWRFQVERDITKKKNGYDGESTKKHNGVNLGEIPEAANSKMACI